MIKIRTQFAALPCALHPNLNPLRFVRGSWQCLHLDRQDGRKVADDGSPGVAGVGRDVDLPACGPK